MRCRKAIAALVFSALATSAHVRVSAQVQTTITDILEAPDTYDGKMVKIQGTVSVYREAAIGRTNFMVYDDKGSKITVVVRDATESSAGEKVSLTGIFWKEKRSGPNILNNWLEVKAQKKPRPPSISRITTSRGSQSVMTEDLASALIRYLDMQRSGQVLKAPGNLNSERLYRLENISVLSSGQKDGVMVKVAYLDEMDTPIAFLYTTQQLKPREQLHGYAEFSGVKEFRTEGMGDIKYIATFTMRAGK